MGNTKLFFLPNLPLHIFVNTVAKFSLSFDLVFTNKKGLVLFDKENHLPFSVSILEMLDPTRERALKNLYNLV